MNSTITGKTRKIIETCWDQPSDRICWVSCIIYWVHCKNKIIITQTYVSKINFIYKLSLYITNSFIIWCENIPGNLTLHIIIFKDLNMFVYNPNFKFVIKKLKWIITIGNDNLTLFFFSHPNFNSILLFCLHLFLLF